MFCSKNKLAPPPPAPTGVAATVTFTMYVWVVIPSCAVTTMVIVLEPTINAIEPEGEPEETVVLLTLIVALAWFTVGVTVALVTPLATKSV